MRCGAAGQVVITLTTMDDGWAVPLTNTSYGPSNTSHAQFLHDIGVWSNITKHLWIWDCEHSTTTYCRVFAEIIVSLHFAAYCVRAAEWLRCWCLADTTDFENFIAPWPDCEP